MFFRLLTALPFQTKVEGTGERLEKGEQVTIIYSLTLTSGKTIDDKVEQTFQLGDGEVISGNLFFDDLKT